jgi:hypothetical protein
LINISNPAAAEKLFEPGAGNEQVADGPANAEFLAKLAGSWFGKTQEMAKFPVMQALALAGHVAAVGDDGFDNGVEVKIGYGSGSLISRNQKRSSRCAPTPLDTFQTHRKRPLSTKS